ncbi:hypothetical protein SAMN05216267_106810 [Actinacidiphila rubida]|uniref:Uncharacterized protein n=1 Tax=Actinacidiphila rubida TaxID=310780 RepID=A0A1H8RBD2_9ACTN|nr:hypothetical protein SAMN05216267_103390 [Actinacidiphila rubida]SEP00334.1 hypothetical protein SAMN05216267_106810 [Actinacidiphila rubida]
MGVDHHDERHADLWLIANRLALEITYQSVYSSKDFRTSYRLDAVTALGNHPFNQAFVQNGNHPCAPLRAARPTKSPMPG